jgi:formylglycine-generating enzyme required for sulfatase activity
VTSLLNLCRFARLLSPLLIVGCAAQSVATPTLLPTTPINSNADWSSQVETFNGIPMVYVPAGCFTMGHGEGRRDERPEHEVCIESAFWIGQTEVTNAQYGSPGAFEGDDVARGNLLWSEARGFCTNKGMRLPTEAEWEYAARGPDSLLYPWGNDLNTDNLIFDQNSGGQVAAVGSRPSGASWVGAFDMSGNVFEWVSSLYMRYPYDATDGREDMTNTTDERVYRSGWGSYIDYGVSAPIRFRAAPDFRDWFLGFRCARDV